MSSLSELKYLIENLEGALEEITKEATDNVIKYVIQHLIELKEKLGDEELRLRCLELAVESQRDMTGDIYSEKGKVFYRFIKGEEDEQNG